MRTDETANTLYIRQQAMNTIDHLFRWQSSDRLIYTHSFILDVAGIQFICDTAKKRKIFDIFLDVLRNDYHCPWVNSTATRYSHPGMQKQGGRHVRSLLITAPVFSKQYWQKAYSIMEKMWQITQPAMYTEHQYNQLKHNHLYEQLTDNDWLPTYDDLLEWYPHQNTAPFNYAYYYKQIKDKALFMKHLQTYEYYNK